MSQEKRINQDANFHKINITGCFTNRNAEKNKNSIFTIYSKENKFYKSPLKNDKLNMVTQIHKGVIKSSNKKKLEINTQFSNLSSNHSNATLNNTFVKNINFNLTINNYTDSPAVSTSREYGFKNSIPSMYSPQSVKPPPLIVSPQTKRPILYDLNINNSKNYSYNNKNDQNNKSELITLENNQDGITLKSVLNRTENKSPAVIKKLTKLRKIRITKPAMNLNLNSESSPTKKRVVFEKNISNLNVNEEVTIRASSPITPLKPKSLLFDNSTFFKHNIESAKKGNKSAGLIHSFGVNTHYGNFRSYNEDRVSIILNLLNPNLKINEKWPQISYFAIYDGHGGYKCADFMKDNLHHYILNDPKAAILNGFEDAERNFMSMAYNENSAYGHERSGTCALVIIIIEETCFVANLGDSRALLSEENSSRVFTLTRDHRPDDILEKERIEKAGGKIYQNKYINNITRKEETGPLRILPGKLSVSRSFGDIMAKNHKLGGNNKVLLAVPEIKSFKISDKTDFIMIGCDGIFEKLTNTDIIHSIWSMANDKSFCSDIHDHSGKCADIIITNSLERESSDNLTCIIISFANFKNNLCDVNFQNSLIRSKYFEKLKNKIGFLNDFDIVEKQDENLKNMIWNGNNGEEGLRKESSICVGKLNIPQLAINKLKEKNLQHSFMTYNNSVKKINMKKIDLNSKSPREININRSIELGSQLPILTLRKK